MGGTPPPPQLPQVSACPYYVMLLHPIPYCMQGGLLHSVLRITGNGEKQEQLWRPHDDSVYTQQKVGYFNVIIVIPVAAG